MKLLLQLLTARGLARRLSLLAAALVALFMWWQGELRAGDLPSTGQAVLQGRVIKVLDGDTLELLDRHGDTQRVRLAYIDAPEHDQAYGSRARQHLAGLAFGRQVEVSSHGRDKYQRLLADVSVEGTDLGEAQLAAGMAWHYLHYAEQDQPAAAFGRYQAAEQTARLEKRGLWQAARPIPPWQFRRQGAGSAAR